MTPFFINAFFFFVSLFLSISLNFSLTPILSLLSITLRFAVSTFRYFHCLFVSYCSQLVSLCIAFIFLSCILLLHHFQYKDHVCIFFLFSTSFSFFSFYVSLLMFGLLFFNHFLFHLCPSVPFSHSVSLSCIFLNDIFFPFSILCYLCLSLSLSLSQSPTFPFSFYLKVLPASSQFYFETGPCRPKFLTRCESKFTKGP